jgi:anti-sigma factor RsiW
LSGQSGQKELAVQYLLGTLSDEESAQMEERYFSDDAKFEDFEIAEEELIDRYVRGELSEFERNQLERTIAASPRLKERVQFARVWKDKLAASTGQATVSSRIESPKVEPPRTTWWSSLFGVSAESRAPRLALAFGMVLLLVGGTAFVFSWMKGREEARQLAAQQAEQRQREIDKQASASSSPADQLATQSPQPSPNVNATVPGQTQNQNSSISKPFVAVTLSPGVTRSVGASNDVRLVPGIKEVRFTLNLRDENYVAYRAGIYPVGRPNIFSSGFVTPRRLRSGAILTINVPAKQLSPGDYGIGLEGRTSSGTVEPVDDYSFRVLR